VQASPSLDRFLLSPADLPTDTLYEQYLQHSYTNVETARERSVDVSTLEAVGRVAAYAREYDVMSSSLFDLYTTIAAYTSETGAAQDRSTRIAQVQQILNSQGQQSRHQSNLGVGDSDEELIYTTSSPLGEITGVYIAFTRSTYTVFVEGFFNGEYASAMMSQLLPLAHLIDAKVQAG
jgi:hypothetical protein